MPRSISSLASLNTGMRGHRGAGWASTHTGKKKKKIAAQPTQAQLQYVTKGKNTAARAATINPPGYNPSRDIQARIPSPTAYNSVPKSFSQLIGTPTTSSSYQPMPAPMPLPPGGNTRHGVPTGYGYRDPWATTPELWDTPSLTLPPTPMGDTNGASNTPEIPQIAGTPETWGPGAFPGSRAIDENGVQWMWDGSKWARIGQ